MTKRGIATMKIICISLGNATMGLRSVGPDGAVTEQSKAEFEMDPEGSCAAIWTIDSETKEQGAVVGIYGDWDAAGYLAHILELLHPRRQINVPDLEAMIRAAKKDGVNICDYCPDYNCRNCVVNNWKGDPDDE